MKNGRLLSLLALTFLIICISPVWALEIGGSYRLENLTFTGNRQKEDNDFSGLDFPMGFSLFANHSLGENIQIDAEYKHDEILRNILTTLFVYNGNFFSIGVGPSLGFLNTAQIIPKIGISSFFRIEWPGKLFAEFWLDNSMGNTLDDPGNYTQERNHLALGFYVDNAICSLNVLSKRFTQKTDSENVMDVLTKYFFATDIFQKNVPYRVLISFGIDALTKTFDDGHETIHSLYSLIVGTYLSLNITDFLTITLDLDSSIYTFGQDELLGVSNPGPAGYLFRGALGFRLNIDKLIQ